MEERHEGRDEPEYGYQGLPDSSAAEAVSSTVQRIIKGLQRGCETAVAPGGMPAPIAHTLCWLSMRAIAAAMQRMEEGKSAGGCRLKSAKHESGREVIIVDVPSQRRRFTFTLSMVREADGFRGRTPPAGVSPDSWALVAKHERWTTEEEKKPEATA